MQATKFSINASPEKGSLRGRAYRESLPRNCPPEGVAFIDYQGISGDKFLNKQSSSKFEFIFEMALGHELGGLGTCFDEKTRGKISCVSVP